MPQNPNKFKSINICRHPLAITCGAAAYRTTLLISKVCTVFAGNARENDFPETAVSA
jgi:hypothetical protein